MMRLYWIYLCVSLLLMTACGNETLPRSAQRSGTDQVNPKSINFDLDAHGQTPLHHAVTGNQSAEVKRLLEMNGNPNIRDKNGQTPLHLAVIGFSKGKGESAIIQMLLEYGGDPNIPDANGMTPLHHEIESGDLTVAKMLLDHGAHPNNVDKSNRSCLDYAPTDSEMARLLRDYGAI